MKLGTRIAISTVALVIVALGASGIVSVRLRQAELAADLERQTQAVGATLQVALEAALREGLFEDVRKLVARIQAAEQRIGIAFLELEGARSGFGVPAAPAPRDAGATPPDGGAEIAAGNGVDEEEEVVAPPPPDPTREARIRRMLLDAAPVGEHIEREGRPIYAWAVPLRDERDRIVALIDLTRDESDVRAAVASEMLTVTATVVGVGLFLAFLVWLTTRGAISRPLERLVEGIDEVSHGDLTRVILRERDDEIGDLADRFNQMTTSLREARDETRRSAEARSALEGRLRHSDKLATIGQLAAGIAHEVGTPLNVIGGRARALEKKAADPSEVAKNAGIIADQAARITRIIQQLLDYARKKVDQRGAVDMAKVARDTLDFLDHPLSSRGVAAKLHPHSPDGDGAPDAPLVVGDADQLQQVCLNLCLNAVQAMEQGGAMEVATRGVVRRKPGLDAAPPGRYVVLEVADSGVGIPAEDRERIFEPFYSTKQEDGGTGLGLAVSQGIVKDHDGWIEIDARPEGGTVFRVFLPAVEPEG